MSPRGPIYSIHYVTRRHFTSSHRRCYTMHHHHGSHLSTAIRPPPHCHNPTDATLVTTVATTAATMAAIVPPHRHHATNIYTTTFISFLFQVKENQEKDKIGSKPDKNGKRGEARKSLKQLQWIKEEKPKKTQIEWSKTHTR
nr:hypothetical protein [Tanacetum cinerariifolium]